MVEPSQILKIEAALDQAGTTVPELCRRARIAASTWGRWRRGKFYPLHNSWKAVGAAFRDLTGKDIRDITEAAPSAARGGDA